MTQARKQETSTEPFDTEWVSLQEATRLLGINRERVFKLALKGALAADHRGNITYISRASIDAYLAALEPAGGDAE